MGGTSLHGMTALVTGAAKRLGRAIALSLADQGVNVVVHYRSSEAAAAELCAQLADRGVSAFRIQADLRDVQQAEFLLRRAVALAGPIHILVNNASAFGPSTLGDVAFGQIAHDAAVNAYAPLALSRAFASQRVTGRIVNVLDARIRTYDWSHVAYILSKHMLAVLTRMTALDFAPDVTVNAVAPGLILPPPGEDEGYLKRCAESLPLKRHGDTEDVADAVVFLARSNFITGQVIYVDGGHHLRSGCAD